MPRAVNGDYSLPSGTLVTTGDTILVSQHNPAMQDIAETLTATLDRDGKGAMRANLNMGGYKLTNFGTGTSDADLATIGQVRAGPVNAVEEAAIDCSLGNYFTKTVTEATAFTFMNVPAGAYGMTLRVNHTSGAITFPSSVRWPRGAPAPTLTTGRYHLFMFVTDNGGSVWRAAALTDYTA